jgi:hypothetical protein
MANKMESVKEESMDESVKEEVQEQSHGVSSLPSEDVEIKDSGKSTDW